MENTQLKNIDSFLDQMLKNLYEAGLNVDGLFCDHIGFRTASLADYEKTKNEFALLGKEAGSADIAGRQVVIFELVEPVIYGEYKIPAIELLAPKETDNYKNGPEHLEFVLNESFESFMSKHPDVEFETYRMDRENNPEIKVYFNDKTSVKFHKAPILEVLKIQRETGKL